MLYFNHLGTFTILVVLLLFVITNIVANFDKQERLKLITKQLVSIVTLCTILMFVDSLFQRIVVTEMINSENGPACALVYISSAIGLWYGVSAITNKIISYAFAKCSTRKLINKESDELKTEQRVISSKELPKKILFHIEESLTEASIESSKIPEDIELIVFGTNVTTYKDGRTFYQNVYSCKRRSDEPIIRQRLFDSSPDTMKQ